MQGGQGRQYSTGRAGRTCIKVGKTGSAGNPETQQTAILCFHAPTMTLPPNRSAPPFAPAPCPMPLQPPHRQSASPTPPFAPSPPWPPSSRSQWSHVLTLSSPSPPPTTPLFPQSAPPDLRAYSYPHATPCQVSTKMPHQTHHIVTLYRKAMDNDENRQTSTPLTPLLDHPTIKAPHHPKPPPPRPTLTTFQPQPVEFFQNSDTTMRPLPASRPRLPPLQ